MTQPTQYQVLDADRVLTNLSIANMSDMSGFVAGRVFPTVPVNLQASKFKTYRSGDFDRTAVKTANSNSQKTTTYTQGGERAGVAGMQSFYLVLRSIDSNTETSGMFRLQWEESKLQVLFETCFGRVCLYSLIIWSKLGTSCPSRIFWNCLSHSNALFLCYYDINNKALENAL